MFYVKVPQTKDLGFWIQEYVIRKGTVREEKRRRRIRRGVIVTGHIEKGPFNTYDEAWLWIFHHQSCSVHCALTQQGYIIEQREAA